MTQSLRIHVQPPGEFTFEAGNRDIQRLLGLPDSFPVDVEAAAARAASNPRLPALDRTDLELVTIDPPGSMDLDQAMLLERRPDGFRVHYAIADVAAFVAPGDPVDLEAHRRGVTLYGADSRIPLHPPVLSEGAASLLPGEVRPALLWTIELDIRGELDAVDVRRAQVRSRARFDYPAVQRSINDGSAGPMWAVLQEIGELRQQIECARGGVSLALPAQEIGSSAGHWDLVYRASLPVELWNAQISLLTGMAAAQLMLRAKVGLLRTLPPPSTAAISRLRLTAKALRIPWPESEVYADFIRTLEPARPAHVAMMTACTTVLRGAGYAAFDGALPAQALHSALATPYAHVTAPLRRLADRYAGEVCLAICAGQAAPAWALAALPELPAEMRAADRRAGQYQRAIIDLIEALLMAPQIGATFEGIITATDQQADRPAASRAQTYTGVVMLRDPAIEARIEAAAPLTLGATVRVKLVEADPAKRLTAFELVG